MPCNSVNRIDRKIRATIFVGRITADITVAFKTIAMGDAAIVKIFRTKAE